MEQRWLVFGARGYVGRRLLAALRADGVSVTGSDIRADIGETLLLGDVRDEAFVEQCFAAARPDVVVHLASFGMSGGEMADALRSWDINVKGTRAVARQCAERRGRVRLIFISTVNVCFNGTEVVDGDEGMACVPPESHTDGYSASKTVAEGIALLESGGNAVSLRPYGIYGDGEERHFPRMLRLFSWGLFMQIGSPADRSDWVYVDNLVHAIRLAATADGAVRGQAFFVGDGEPVNTIDLCAPLWGMVNGGEPRGSLWIPYGLIYGVARVCEALRIPLLSRAEVNKVARTHYWKTQRVQRVLGYRPLVSRSEGLRRMYAWFQAELLLAGYPHAYWAFRRKVRLVLAVLVAAVLLCVVSQ